MDATPQASMNEPGRDGNKLNNRIWGFGMCHSVTRGSSFPRDSASPSSLSFSRYKGYLHLWQHYFDTETAKMYDEGITRSFNV